MYVCIYLSSHIPISKYFCLIEKTYLVLEYIYCHKQNVGRNMNVRGAGEGLEGNEDHDIRNWRRDDMLF